MTDTLVGSKEATDVASASRAVLDEALATVFPELTAHDRCDRCGAQAISQVLTNSDFVLLLCGHHHRKHRTWILEQGYLYQFNGEDEMPYTVSSQPKNAARDAGSAVL